MQMPYGPPCGPADPSAGGWVCPRSRHDETQDREQQRGRTPSEPLPLAGEGEVATAPKARRHVSTQVPILATFGVTSGTR